LRASWGKHFKSLASACHRIADFHSTQGFHYTKHSKAPATIIKRHAPGKLSRALFGGYRNMSDTDGGTFVGFAGILLLSSILCFPMLGITGILSAFCAIYFVLVLTNGADTAAKRRKKRR